MKDLATIIASRIAGRPSYQPAYTLEGKFYSAKIEFNVYKNQRDEKIPYRITAWGAMADAIARGAAVGKKFTFRAEIKRFMGRVWMRMPDNTMQFVISPDGTPLKQWKTGYTIMDIDWGQDSAKCKADEIINGMRPVGWDTPGSPDVTVWKQICANRNAAQFLQGSATFEYSDVVTKNMPQGAIIALPKVAGNAAQPVAQQQVVQQPVQQQVVVNGQNMGYQMPAAQPVAQPAAPVQHVANPAVVQQAIPSGYAQPVAAVPAAVVQPGGYSPVTM